MADVDAHPLPRKALLFMAAVDEARRTTEGPFRAVAPVFRIALEPQRGQVLNIAAAAAALNPILGDNFTEHTLEAFLPQLVALGWLVEEPVGENKAAYRVPRALPTFDEKEGVEASETKLQRLYSAFQEFREGTAPLLKATLTADAFKWQLFRWATSLDGSDKEAIQDEAKRLVEGGKPSLKNAFLDEPQRFSRIGRELSVEFAGFVKWLAKGDRSEIVDIASLTELGLAVEFLEELREPTAQQEVKIGTSFVLDSPVLLDLLGLSGPSRQKSVERCLSTLRERGGKILTLAHCLEELADVLKAVLAKPEARRYGLTGDALRADPKLVERARQVANQPDKAVGLAEVEVIAFDPKNALNANTFPEELIDRFRKSATWHDEYKTEQRERDALSIAFVVRRRRGHYASDVLDNTFVLVTRNNTFTSFSKIFVAYNLDAPNYAFGPAIETKTLAALVWMRFGSIASPDLPQMHLIAACDRILATNGELLRKAERKLKELEGAEAAVALLTSQQAVLDLVIASGGSPDVIDAADGEALLRAFTASAEVRGRKQERQKADEELSRLAKQIAEEQRKVQELETTSAQISADNLAKDARLRQREKELRDRDEADRARVEETAAQIRSEAQRSSWWVVRGVWWTSALLGIVGQFFIWRGAAWWLQSWVTLSLGTVTILCSFLAVAFGLRWVPPGKLDLAAALHERLVQRSIKTRLERVNPTEERERVRTVLLKEGNRLTESIPQLESAAEK